MNRLSEIPLGRFCYQGSRGNGGGVEAYHAKLSGEVVALLLSVPHQRRPVRLLRVHTARRNPESNDKRCPWNLRSILLE